MQSKLDQDTYFIVVDVRDKATCELRVSHTPRARLYSTPDRAPTKFCIWTALTNIVYTMASFSLPQINDNPDGGWGPSSSSLPAQFKFKDIPYAPYSKSDKLGRFADWNDISGDNRPTNLGLSSTQVRGGGQGGRGRRDGQPAFGSGTASAFAYFHAEDESSFSLVDNKTGTMRRGGPLNRGRGGGRGGGGYSRGGAQRGGRGGYNGGRGGGQRGGRRGWRDWEKVGFSFVLASLPEYHNWAF